MQVSLTALLLSCTAIITLAIGIYVYRRGSHAGPNRAFGFMVTTISLWTTAVAIAHYGNIGNIWAVRSAFAFASLIPLGGLAFVERLPVDVVYDSRITRWLFTPVGLALCASSFSPWLVVSVATWPYGSGTTYGPLHPVFAAYMVLSFACSAYLLTLKYRASTARLKLQTRYILIAFTIPIALGLATNLIIPLFLKTSIFGKYGPLFTLFIVGLIGHAIIRHRLMDMRIVIKRSVVYLAAFVAAGLILVTLLVVSNFVLHDQHRTPLREIVLALAVAVFFSPLKGYIQRTFDRYLYREPYDYQRTIREASRALGDTIQLPRLLSYMSGLGVRTLKCEGVAIYLFENDDARFDLAITGTDGKFPDHLVLSSALVARIVRARETVFGD